MNCWKKYRPVVWAAITVFSVTVVLAHVTLGVVRALERRDFINNVLVPHCQTYIKPKDLVDCSAAGVAVTQSFLRTVWNELFPW